MADRKSDNTSREGSAEQRSQPSDTSKRDAGQAQAGQEAAKGSVPAEHDRGHQSKYGGGGANGGTQQ
jgi:hypothetical protein